MTERLTAEIVRELLDYDPATGEFRWKTRHVSWFHDSRLRTQEASCRAWNTLYAGRQAGSRQKRGYVTIRVLGDGYYAHSVAWLYVMGAWPTQIDHIDIDRTNNRFDNLRLASSQQNLQNRGKQKNNTSGLKGVSWSKAAKKWWAQIVADGRHKHLGLFGCPAAAHFAYVVAADKLHGEFARFG